MSSTATATATATAIDNVKVNLNDVLCRRGAFAHYHSGNQRFQTIAKEYQQEYRASKTNIEKRDIVSRILVCINDSGGHFL